MMRGDEKIYASVTVIDYESSANGGVGIQR